MKFSLAKWKVLVKLNDKAVRWTYIPLTAFIATFIDSTNIYKSSMMSQHTIC